MLNKRAITEETKEKEDLCRRKRWVKIDRIPQVLIFREHRLCSQQSVSRDFQNQFSLPELTNSSQPSPKFPHQWEKKDHKSFRNLKWWKKDVIFFLFLTHPPARGKSATEREWPRHESWDGEGSMESETPSSAAHRRNCSMLWCSDSILLLPGFVTLP